MMGVGWGGCVGVMGRGRGEVGWVCGSDEGVGDDGEGWVGVFWVFAEQGPLSNLQ